MLFSVKTMGSRPTLAPRRDSRRAVKDSIVLFAAYSMILVLFGIGMHVLISNIPETSLLPNEGIRSLRRFDQNLDEFLKGEARKRIVFVGPSYAKDIGKPYGSFNLGVNSATPNEVKTIMEDYCRPDDVIIYPISVTQGKGGEIRPEVTSALARRSNIVKTQLRYWLGLDRGQYEEIAERIFPKIRDDQMADMRRMLKDPEAKPLAIRYIHLELFAFELKTKEMTPPVSAEPYVELQRDFPNIRYIYFPALPFDTESEDNEINRQIRLVKEWEGALLADLRNRNIGFLDFSTILKPEDYVTLVHHNKMGIEKIVVCLYEHRYFNN